MAATAPGQPPAPLSFKDRYATDVDFKAQVDESRAQRDRDLTTSSIKSALATASGIPGAKPKMY
jgi:hypothetical protein